jgi:O-succinylhomoserine (thiol)-lyase
MKLRTRAVHTGVAKDHSYNSVITPIYPSSTFYFDAIGKNKGYDYTRSGNPTRSALEENIASLEGGVGCSATATGMAAESSVMHLLASGDHVIAGDDIYGGTYRLFSSVMTRMGLRFSFVNMRDLDAIRSAITPQTRMIWIETPSNPLLRITDIAAVSAIARERSVLTVADNTFLSPYFQRPLELGVDIVVHSTTKYINGHSDVVGGAIVYRTKELEEAGRFYVNALGTSQAPYDSWLALRGVKTLGPRMEAHQHNALAVSELLASHKRVKRVYYPGMPDHPQKELIARQMSGFGGMLSFDLDTEAISMDRFFERLELFTLAESLGGVESLMQVPWLMSHASMGEEGLQKSGITRETIRVSVGIEDGSDLVADLAQALA